MLLQHVALGSQAYCRLVGVTPDGDLYSRAFDPNFRNAWAQTKTLVSGYLTECAVKLRMVQEFCERHHGKDAIKPLEARAMTGLVIGKVAKGSFQLGIREASNKIIHAASADLVFTESAAEVPPVLLAGPLQLARESRQHREAQPTRCRAVGQGSLSQSRTVGRERHA